MKKTELFYSKLKNYSYLCSDQNENKLEERYKKIERAVCCFYKVSADEVYTTKNSVYPYGIARRMMMYLLYVNGMKVYNIAELFGVSVRITNKYVAEIHVEYKKDTKIREDIESINKMLNNQN